MNRISVGLAVVAIVAASTVVAPATVIDFTGGGGHVVCSTCIRYTTPEEEEYSNIDFYVQDGFKVDFINPADSSGEQVGDFFGQDGTAHWNDVIVGRWAVGGCGDMTAVEITKEDGGTFDLNYFILAANTQIDGGPATGDEQTWIHAWHDGAITYSQLLPPDSWGWRGVDNPGPLQNDPTISLGPQFEDVDKVSFTVTNNSAVLALDAFCVNEPAQGGATGVVPEPASILVWSVLGVVGLAFCRFGRR